MSWVKFFLLLALLSFGAVFIYSTIGRLLNLLQQEASIAGAVTFSIVVAIILVYMLYTQKQQ